MEIIGGGSIDITLPGQTDLTTGHMLLSIERAINTSTVLRCHMELAEPPRPVVKPGMKRVRVRPGKDAASKTNQKCVTLGCNNDSNMYSSHCDYHLM